MGGLRALRIAEGLTQAQVAEKLQVEPFSVYRWEAGIANPSMGHLKQLAKIFNCTLDDLICKEG